MIARLALIGLSALVAWLPLSGSANAHEQACGDHSEMVARLHNQYNERLIGVGRTNEGNAMEIFASERGKTWSAIIVRPDGVGCVLSFGDAWTEFRIIPGDDA